MDLEKQMAICRVEQSESNRKFEDLQENKTRVRTYVRTGGLGMDACVEGCYYVLTRITVKVS